MTTKTLAKQRRRTTTAKRQPRNEIEQYNRDLRKHFGRWVCVVNYRVVSVADEPMEALVIARKLGYKNARVKRAPLNPSARLLVA